MTTEEKEKFDISCEISCVMEGLKTEMPTPQTAITLESYVLAWSYRQKCFHVETIRAMILTNAKAFVENRELEYIPITFCKSNADAHELADTLKDAPFAGSVAMRTGELYNLGVRRP